jgi:hypothetical protein
MNSRMFFALIILSFIICFVSLVACNNRPAQVNLTTQDSTRIFEIISKRDTSKKKPKSQNFKSDFRKDVIIDRTRLITFTSGISRIQYPP